MDFARMCHAPIPNKLGASNAVSAKPVTRKYEQPITDEMRIYLPSSYSIINRHGR
jgi:hypothetical protein